MDDDLVTTQGIVDGLLLRIDELVSAVRIVGIVLLTHAGNDITATQYDRPVGGHGQEQRIAHGNERQFHPVTDDLVHAGIVLVGLQSSRMIGQR